MISKAISHLSLGRGHSHCVVWSVSLLRPIPRMFSRPLTAWVNLRGRFSLGIAHTKSFSGLGSEQYIDGASATLSLLRTYSIQIGLLDSVATRHSRDERSLPTSVLHEPRIAAAFAPSLSQQTSKGRPGKCATARQTPRRTSRSSNSKIPAPTAGSSNQAGQWVWHNREGLGAWSKTTAAQWPAP